MKKKLQFIKAAVIFCSSLFAFTKIQAQADTSKLVSYRLPADSSISVAYTPLPANTAGSITFTLTNKSGQAIESGRHFIMQLPAQAGLHYNLAHIQTSNGFPEPAITPEMIIVNDVSANGCILFTCVLEAGDSPFAPSLIFRKQ